jgi:RES domain-containing protein
MIVYRFSHKKFSTELTGTGARLFGGRWNPVGIPVVYASESISLALLEVIANAGSIDDLRMIQLTKITIPDSITSLQIQLDSLKKNWFADFDYTQWMGKEILLSSKSLLIQCPSAIIPQEKNYLINPMHPDSKQIKASILTSFRFDERRFKTHVIS